MLNHRLSLNLAPLLLALVACSGGPKDEGTSDTASEASSGTTSSSGEAPTTSASSTDASATDASSTTGGDVDLVACEEPALGVGDVHFEITLNPEPEWWSFHLDVPCTIAGTEGADSYDAISLECDDEGAPLSATISYDNGQLLLPAQEIGAAVRLEIAAFEAESQGRSLTIHREDDQSLILGLSEGPFIPPHVEGEGFLAEFWAPFVIAPALTECADHPGTCTGLQRPAALRILDTPSGEEAVGQAFHVVKLAGYGIHIGEAVSDIGDENMCDGGVSTDYPFIIVNKPG